MTKIKYEKKMKILSIRLSNNPSVDSDVRENVIIDYDKNGKVVNIEIMNISFEEFSKTKNYLDKLLHSKETVTSNRFAKIRS